MMSNLKTQADVELYNTESQEDPVVSEKKGTPSDQKDMYRMGKTQELRRNFGFVSILAYSMTLMATWETVLTTLIIPLTNGGTGGAITMFLGTSIGMGFVVVSMAEMASMAPTEGGQYHWVSEFAPKAQQKFLSYVVGWLCVLGWQTGTVSIAFLVSGQIQGLMVLNNAASYMPERWHGTLLVIAVATSAIIFNTLLARKLPLIEELVLILHVLGFIVFFVTMWVLAPRSKASDVFSGFQDNAGWGNTGLSVLVGQLAPIFSLLGADAACHLSEELKDAAYTLPRTMIWTACSNSILGILMLVTFCFCLGDIESVIMTPTGQPHIQVLYNVTKSTVAASALASITLIMAVFGCVNNVATSSRQLFAFARDNGVPFSGFLSHVRWDLPINSIVVSFTVSVLLSLINIGSTVAFNSIASLGSCALLSSYIISVGCMFVKRWRNEPLLPCKFSLGRAGIWINGISVMYLIWALIFAFFPTFPHPTPDLMNWNILIYGVVVAFALVFFLVKGRKVYVGPVEYTKKDL
ncbi:amino acid transporter [Dothidotthia symphoricarpi CBS 119687]|uniref:Amino acid transporter n=1 Tax=Dothidotthia symphoricarpi CBS 119687 TaxID=1392245 RepID=A0A6A6ACY4_9PLEO|nr:amino acid transporter [Dothidotthia symphoricarpi CBS 119687]KAF2128737.1 amino acid transporter [Dothidotthia symphoricarpi CBS 119687]